ncbi:hypothetical protein [Nocardia ninae]|uniref:Uncharacterized protein n=2 Tax=Nocardia ninae TaxID=356145 RepID=A0A511M6Z9_9NOCA|nr:hypothetical protein [Nocardia ninae]GEM35977.1 hypothetical protein NN4_04960 [Nocardia ninae NBRC 108245]
MRRLWQRWQLTRARCTELTSQRPLELLRPLIGAAAALALTIGGIVIALEHTGYSTPVKHTECTRLWVEGSTLPECPIMLLVRVRLLT